MLNKIQRQCEEEKKEKYVIVNLDGDKMNHNEYGFYADNNDYLEFESIERADDFLKIWDIDDKFNVGCL